MAAGFEYEAIAVDTLPFDSLYSSDELSGNVPLLVVLAGKAISQAISQMKPIRRWRQPA